MKQVVQDLRTGDIYLLEQPVPALCPGQVLIRSVTSLLSSGTERTLVDFGRSSMIQKALSQPEKVREVLQKAVVDGIGSAIAAVQTKMADPYPLGYCNAGVVEDCADDVAEFKVGDRVASNGRHAEFVAVPKNLCARIPDPVSDEEACFTPLAAVALQGARLLAPSFGEQFGVIGLGLVGLLAAQVLRLCGARVIGFEINRHRLGLAAQLGIPTVDLSVEDPVVRALEWSQGAGLDGVIIATSTSDTQPISNAAAMCRQRGRIVLIGVCGLELDRNQFYKKELTFQVSCSYGPGRYDPQYEEGGHDYPLGFVRWTEQRNFQAALGAMAERKLDARSLVTDRIPHEAASKAYERLSRPDCLGVVLQYPVDAPYQRRLEHDVATAAVASRGAGRVKARVALVGAGSFARSTLLPILRELGVELRGVSSQNGLHAAQVAKKFGFQYSTSDAAEVLEDAETNVVFVATPHHLHGRLVQSALSAGKHVFVEKPLCISEGELGELETLYREVAVPGGLLVMIGFNRRFSSVTQKMKALLRARLGPLSMVYTVNAGFVPRDHWTHNPSIGGGRIIGEACHFMDLLSFLADSPIEAVQASMAGDRDDEMSITLRMQNGAIGTVHYFASGHKSFPKEILKVFADGSIIVNENFRRLRGYGMRGFRRFSLWNQEKGHRQEVEEFLRCIEQNKPSPIPFDSIVNVTRATFAAVRAARKGTPQSCH